MVKKYYLGHQISTAYLNLRGEKYCNHNAIILENKENKSDLEIALEKISKYDKKKRRIEIYVDKTFLPITEEIKQIVTNYFPKATIKEYPNNN